MAKRSTQQRVVVRAPQLRWADWADGSWWDLRMGEDHDQPPRKAAQAARMWAKRNGMWANIVINGDDTDPWSVQFVPRGDR